MDSMFANYPGGQGAAYDEMFDHQGEVRSAYRGIFKVMAESERAVIASITRRLSAGRV